MVGVACDSGQVRVTERDLERIPLGNLRVPRGEFGALWQAAADLVEAHGERGITNWAAGGVARTCRWVARAASELPNGRRILTPAPVTARRVLAAEESIEAEYLAAEKMLASATPPVLVSGQPGYVEAVSATLRWAWRASGPVPVLQAAVAG
jgi:hypothetical protein